MSRSGPFPEPAAVSLFSGAGIGDAGFRAAGMKLLALCEMQPDRAALGALNFPEAAHFPADIGGVGDGLCSRVEEELRLRGTELFLVSCTAPCQGMSKNGQGTLLKNIRKGLRPKLDPRNRLILPALEIIRRLNPRWVVFENVCEMKHTVIEDGAGTVRPILEVIRGALAGDYVGEAYEVEVADYGIPQRRSRLITVYTRDPVAKLRFQEGGALIPDPTHGRKPASDRKPWVSVAEALRSFPELDAGDASRASSPDVPFHRVPVLDPKKYEWIRHAAPGASAFDNQCANPACGFQDNPVHAASRGDDGINRSRKDTPLYCLKCGHLLPRPYALEADGSKRLMSGYTSAYKRMAHDLPSPALTRNLSYPCSDQKVHPFQNRVLSLAEAMELQTIPEFGYRWGPMDATRSGGVASDALIRSVIGESVPPRLFHLLGGHILEASNVTVAKAATP